MPELRANKIEAARRQLEAAIRMLFGNEDALAVHTVASASHQVLRDLAEKRGNSEFHASLKIMIKPGMEKEFWKVMNKTANFLKHADRDPEALLNGVKENINELTIAGGCLYYKSLGFELTPTMRVFMVWFSVMNPHLLADDDPMKRLLDEKQFQSIRSQSRIDQLEIGKLLLEQVQKQITP
jgi:hypothetical protein